MSLINKIIANFKDCLMNNYYSRSLESEFFIEWLHSNLQYTNGVVKIRDKKINTETEQEPSDESIDTLKNLVQGWARSRFEKQDYWDNLLTSRTSYLNGTLCLDDENTSYIQQDMTGFISYETDYQGQAMYYLESRLSPTVEGQTIKVIPEYTVYATYVDDNSRLVMSILSYTPIESITFVAEPYNKNDLIYSGGSVTVTVE